MAHKTKRETRKKWSRANPENGCRLSRLARVAQKFREAKSIFVLPFWEKTFCSAVAIKTSTIMSLDVSPPLKRH
jgi:hypothetical protein